MNKMVITGARVVLGLILLVFGLNGFLNFLPMPEMTGGAGAFMAALAATGYMIPVIKAFEVIIGVMLLANKYVPLALVMLAPLTLNFVLFHLVLDIAGIAIAAVTAVLHVFLVSQNCKSYQGFFK